MPEKGSPSSIMILYGVAIGDALARKNRNVDELIELRNQANVLLGNYGDLASAVKELDAEIEKSGGASKSVESSSNRFAIVVDGLPLSKSILATIEDKIRELVLSEVAKTDFKGDLIATPLSEIKTFGGMGGATMGLIVSPKI